MHCSTRLLCAVTVVLFAGFASGFGCNPFYFNSMIPTIQSCPANTMTIGGDPIRTQVDIDISYCGQALSTILKGFSVSATANYNDYFEYSTWHEETDVQCNVDLGYDTGAGSYNYLRNAGVQDQNGLTNDPNSLIPFYTYKKWYTRRFSIPSDFVGKSLVLAFACSTPANFGPRTYFVRDVRILASDGVTVRSTIDVTCTGASCGPTCARSTGACHDIGTSMFCSCTEAWSGVDCGTPTCAIGCVNGGCNNPGECICQQGWSGPLCNVPVCATGCKNGACTQPDQCNCNSGWQGSLCDAAICSPTCNTAGATCNLPGECNCNVGWSGPDCNETICKQGCQYGTCQVANECNCLSGWQGDVCDTFYCSSACNAQGGSCTGPNQCTCNPGYSGATCDTYCTLPKPVEQAECVVVDGGSVWVVNGSLTVNSTTTVNNQVIIYGDLEVTNFGQLVINGSSINVFGCLDVQNQSSLAVTLTPKEIEELKNSGVLNRTVITFSPLCDTPNDFGVVSVTNPGQFSCATLQNDQVQGPGLVSILFTLERQTCNTEVPSGNLISDNTGQLVDWQIAVIVVACVVAAGAAITAGILIRKRQLDKEVKSVGTVHK